VSTDPTETVPTILVAHTVGAARFLLLNRPERRNALVPDLARKLAAEVRAAEQDKGIRAVALRGAGGHFSVGLDLKWYLTLGDTPPRSVLEEGLRAFQDTIRAVVRSPLPIIALLEGSVAGFGLDLALACDLRIATHTATLSSAFAQMGLVPDGGSTYTLPRLVGTEHASSILMSGETVDAERAQSIGLVSAVTSEDSLEAVAGALVERIASQSRRSVAQIKALTSAGSRPALEARLEREGKAQVEALLSQEFRARLDAFLRRTKPL
jgi:2-(1,2-epoxy-1,2-dihydrophenyl)acetyl-CoA isomerase